MKKHIKILFSMLITLLLSVSVFIACDSGSNGNDPLVNYYNGGETDSFSFSKWHSGVAEEIFEIDDEEVPDETFVIYRKYGLNTYPQVQSKVEGPLSDFEYLNFELKANKSIMMSAQLVFFTGYYNNDGSEEKESLIGELIFDVDTTAKIYSFKIFDNKRLMMDFTHDVWLFPEPGMSGAEYVGNFTLFDSYFSKELPDNSVFVNESGNGDSTSPEQKIGNWRNESTWTGYKAAPNSSGEVDINFTRAASWATLSRVLTDFDLAHNTLDISFMNNELGVTGQKYSITQINFRLRGDKKELINDPAGYSYWSYYEADFGEYKLDEAAQNAKPSDNHRVDLSFDIINARNNIKKHITDGVRLVMLIESHPDNKYTGNTANYDGMGSMSVLSVETKRDETKPDIINNTDFIGDGCYVLSSVNGETLEVTYNSTTQHANIWHEFDPISAAATYSFTIKNEGGAAVELRYCFAANGTDSDFAEISLAAGETQTFEISLTARANLVKIFFDSNESVFGPHANSRLVISDFGIAG